MEKQPKLKSKRAKIKVIGVLFLQYILKSILQAGQTL